MLKPKPKRNISIHCYLRCKPSRSFKNVVENEGEKTFPHWILLLSLFPPTLKRKGCLVFIAKEQNDRYRVLSVMNGSGAPTKHSFVDLMANSLTKYPSLVDERLYSVMRMIDTFSFGKQIINSFYPFPIPPYMIHPIVRYRGLLMGRRTANFQRSVFHVRSFTTMGENYVFAIQNTKDVDNH